MTEIYELISLVRNVFFTLIWVYLLMRILLLSSLCKGGEHSSQDESSDNPFVVLDDFQGSESEVERNKSDTAAAVQSMYVISCILIPFCLFCF